MWDVPESSPPLPFPIELCKVKRKVLFAQLYLTPRDSMNCSRQVPLSMEFSSKNTGVACHFFLQGILSQRSNPGLLHYQLILDHLSYQRSPMVTGMAIKSWSEPPGYERQTQHTVKFKVFATVWESCTGSFCGQF